jgi:FecR protein
MADEYLWNREGEHDAEVARLEQVLRPLRYEPTPFRFPRTAQPRRRSSWVMPAAAAAIAIVALATGARVWIARAPAESAWSISWNGASPQRVRNGQFIVTGKHSAAKLESDFVGEVELGPESRLRVVESSRNRQRLLLQNGDMHAFIWAPPREFVVDTPSATTVDLGCAYTLHVAADGAGLLTVQTGWVAFEWRGIETFIPSGAACTTRAGRGPGTPYFIDAPPALQSALARFDADGNPAALEVVLNSARPRDALTLWHLLGRTPAEQRGQVFDRFSSLLRLPPSVTREKILAGRTSAMDAAWNALGFGNTDWWRGWKRNW